MNINESLTAIQCELKAPKNQKNTFGNYKYRSCEDILEAAKPLLAKRNLAVTISDTIVEVGGRIYVKATATVRDFEGNTISVEAYAREPEVKKGMDESQITGATSSYARKYALNGLFAIDDTKDADSYENVVKTEKPAPKKATAKKEETVAQEPLPFDIGEQAFTVNPQPVLCTACKKPIVTVGKYTAEMLIEKTNERYGAPYCYECLAAQAKKQQATQEGQNNA